MPGTKEKKTPLRWMISGFATFVLYEIFGILYAVTAGRLKTTPETLWVGVFLIIGVGLEGVVFGLLFAHLHTKLWMIGLYLRGILFYSAVAVLIQLVSTGPPGLFTDDSLLSLGTFAAAGPYYCFLRKRLLLLARFLSFLGYALEHDSGLSLPQLPDSGCTLGHDPDLGNLAVADILSFFPQTIVKERRYIGLPKRVAKYVRRSPTYRTAPHKQQQLHETQLLPQRYTI